MKNTIKSTEQISWLFSHGSRYHGAGFLALYAGLAGAEKDDKGRTDEKTGKVSTGDTKGLKDAASGRLAFVAGKKLGTAPMRNKAKRLLREATRQAGAPWNGYDVVLIAKKGVLNRDFTELVGALKHFATMLEQERPAEALKNEQNEKADENEKKKNFFSFVVGIPRRLAIVCISIYRHAISPLFPPSCRYVPSCSEYAMIALERYGFLKGVWLSIKRVGRCHPFHPGGYDPVPEELSKS